VAIPGLVQHVVYANNGQIDTETPISCQLPNATLANNCILLKLSYPQGATLSSIVTKNSAGTTLDTFSLTPLKTTTDAGNTVTTAIFGFFGCTAGAVTVVIAFTAAQNGISPAIMEWYNIATSSATDGTGAAVSGNQTGAISSGSFTTGTPGDLVLQWIMDNDNSTAWFAGTNQLDNFTAFTKGSGMTFAQADLQNGYACQYQIQGSAGATNPSITTTPSGTFSWSSITLALKSASAGTAPSSTALRVFGVYHTRPGSYTGTTGTGNWKVQFPCAGNTFAMLFSDPNGQIKVTAVSGVTSGTWTAFVPSDTGCPSTAYKTSATASTDEILTLTLNDASIHGYIQGCLYDIVNGGAFNQSAFLATGSFSLPGNSNAAPANITPLTATGISLSCVGLATGPPDSLVTPSGGQFMSTYGGTGQTDASSFDNGDCHGFLIFSSAASQSWVYHVTNNSGSSSGDANGTYLEFAAGSSTAADGASRAAPAPGFKAGTPTSRLRSVLDTGTTPPPFIDQTAGWRPRTLRLGTPVSRLRSAVLDTGTTPPPFIDQTAGWRPRRLRLGTPVSLLRSAVLDTGTTQLTTGLLSAYGVSLSSATFDMTGSPGFLTVNAVSASAAAVPPAGGVGLTGASASTAAVPSAGGIGATGVSAATAAVEVDAGISASGVSGSTATVDFTGSPGFMNLPGVSASVAIFPLSPGAFFISTSGASASTATFDMTGSPGFLTASAASASAAVFPLSGGIGMVGASASGVVFQLSGGISLFGVTASAAAFPLAGGVSFNGAAASAAIYTAVGVAANSIFLTGVSGSAGHLTLIGVSTVQNLHEIGLGGLMLRLGGRVGGN
jgi:hypothetical protein